MNKSALLRVEFGLMRRFVFVLSFALATTASVGKRPASSDSQRDGPKMSTVLVLGDSLSAGYGLQRSQAYPQLLAQKAVASGHNVQILNAGVSGDTTAGGLRRLPQLLRQHVDVLVVELGINDAFRGVPVPRIEANTQAIIDLAKKHYPQVHLVIVGMQLSQHSTDEYIRAFGEMFERIARQNNASFVPFLLEGVAGNPALNLPDMIHPNAAGQRVLAANVWPVLERALP